MATLLEDSVQKAGNQVLINVQLIDARTDAHIWVESYTRTLDNVPRRADSRSSRGTVRWDG